MTASSTRPSPAARLARAAAAGLLVALVLAACPVPATAAPPAPAAAPEPARIGDWLVLGPFATRLPAFAGEDTLHRVGSAQLLEQPPLDPSQAWPRAGQRLQLPGGGEAAWVATSAGAAGLELAAGAQAAPGWAAAATYLEVDGFTRAKLSLRCTQPFAAWLDGERVALRATPDSAAAAVEAELVLEAGKHPLLVQSLADPAGPAAWTLGATIAATAPAGAPAPTASTSPLRPVRIADYLDTQAVSGIQLSAAGDLLAVTWRRPEVPSADSETWVEIRRAADGAVLRTIRGEAAGSFTWGSAGQRFSYVTSRDDKSTLWVDDFADGPARAVLRDVAHLGGHRWLPGGRSILYTLEEERGSDPEGVKRLRGLTDRWAGARSVGSLHEVAVADGVTRRLTAGRWSCEVQDAAADGSRLLLVRTIRDDARFPFSEDELHELDLATLATTLVTTVPRGVTARYGPREGQLLLRAGPSAFGNAGRNLPDDRIANDYDGQLYLFERAGDKVTPLTRAFAPSLGDFAWSPRAARLFATATDTTAVGLWSWEPAKGTWAALPSGCEAVGGIALSADGSRLAWYGEDAMSPERIWTLDLARKGARPVMVASPAAGLLADVGLGRHETWDFTAASGTRILGDVYYPPRFADEPGRKWPCIVFYYGGTSPVSREYGGRYPKNLWAANGYVVYVLQPSGATGFGQEFSSRHVNDWGLTTADEVIEGTRKFLEAHPFVDGGRVGCIGASYGGFLTMNLLTKTDLFAAAVSHAGISALSSYWGEGWWGVDYSSMASAGSYPWNRPDLYVEHSPLFHADRITTPLLLLHGAGDTNVPVGESEQMYAALRVLGKPVEYVKVDGQNHWILNYPQRELWMRTIIAWFDRELKDQPAWWDHLYGEGAGGR